MERAVEVMRESIAERRDDDKESPLVGAVVVKYCRDGASRRAPRWRPRRIHAAGAQELREAPRRRVTVRDA